MSKDLEYLWKANQRALGLTDEQVEMMKKDPKAVKMIENSPALYNRKIVAEVVKTRNCLFHKVGDRIVFRVAGGMIKEESCENPCLYALGPLATLGYVIFDRVASGLDPSEIMIDSIKCMDVGVENGGVGEILMKVRVE
ncbi:MAG: hypothetical protein Q6352_015725 [Candidatus Freyrarchaeum guaymaensis]|nr:hypothetical protein [Candidatus Sigynarchaeota archaeon]